MPIGIVAFVLGSRLIVENEGIGLRGGVDWLGSVLITLATMAGAFAIVKSSDYGLTSARTLGVGGGVAGAARRASSRSSRAWRTRSCRCGSCACAS